MNYDLIEEKRRWSTNSFVFIEEEQFEEVGEFYRREEIVRSQALTYFTWRKQDAWARLFSSIKFCIGLLLNSRVCEGGKFNCLALTKPALLFNGLEIFWEFDRI